jgi:hypothetical protein
MVLVLQRMFVLMLKSCLQVVLGSCLIIQKYSNNRFLKKGGVASSQLVLKKASTDSS